MAVEVSKNPDLKWSSIENEKYRTYVFANEQTITILNPRVLNVSKSGGHRVLDKQDVAHYIPFTWIHLYWEVKADAEAFQF